MSLERLARLYDDMATAAEIRDRYLGLENDLIVDGGQNGIELVNDIRAAWKGATDLEVALARLRGNPAFQFVVNRRV